MTELFIFSMTLLFLQKFNNSTIQPRFGNHTLCFLKHCQCSLKKFLPRKLVVFKVAIVLL